MLSKAKIKLVQSLRLAKFRKQHGLFVAEGTTNVRDFIQGGLEPEMLFASESWVNAHAGSPDLKDCLTVTEREMKMMSNLKTPSGVLGVFNIPRYKPLELQHCEGWVLMLEDIRDPGNLGTIIRTADWFGIGDVVCSPESVDAFNPKVVQASMGSLARVHVHYEFLDGMISKKPADLKVYGAVLDGTAVRGIEKPGKGILLIGNEARGISAGLLQHLDHRITIPGARTAANASAESLNASVAAAILCYELTGK